MILLWIFLLPLLAGAVAWFAARRFPALSLWVGPTALILILLQLLSVWGSAGSPESGWLVTWSAPWIPQLGMSFAFALDGLSLILSILTCLVGLVALFMMGEESTGHAGLRRFLVLSTLASLFGVFLASDLILFFVFYEIMLVPVFALLLLGDHPNRVRAALRFFIFTQAGGLLMLVSIFGLYILHGQATGEYTFASDALLNTSLSAAASAWIFLGFFFAFAVKLPLVPFHTWQADAYEAAPAETSVLLAGLMAKAAGYGLLRFAIPLAPEGAAHYASGIVLLGVITVLYCAWMAYGQTDLKRIIAYSSASHLGYIALGAFSMSPLAQRGAVIQMFCHGISVAGLFFITDLIERKMKTRNIEALGGLWHTAPRLGAVALVFAMATLGLPGLGNFVGEFMTLVGTFKSYPVAAGCAAIGAVLAAAYSLRVVQRIFFGPKPENATPWDATPPQLALCAILIAVLVWLGAYPKPFLDTAWQAGAARTAVSSLSGSPMADMPAEFQTGERQ
jgi:NADH-quinone oxidoreductase subunit M